MLHTQNNIPVENTHMEQNVLIVESTGQPLQVASTPSPCLEGVFAVLGVKNKNQRIYEENEYLPHLDYLQQKAANRSLVGEIDHPERRFAPRLDLASHVVTEIYYDQATKQVRGKIELLKTDKGEALRKLMESNIPLSISSRAAGVVGPDSRVRLRQIYTYDVVIDPGFAEAKLTPVQQGQMQLSEELVALNESLQSAYQTDLYHLATESSYQGWECLNESLHVLDPHTKIYRIPETYLQEQQQVEASERAQGLQPTQAPVYVTRDQLEGYATNLNQKLLEALAQLQGTSPDLSELRSDVETLTEMVELLREGYGELGVFLKEQHQSQRNEQVLECLSQLHNRLERTQVAGELLAGQLETQTADQALLREQLETLRTDLGGRLETGLRELTEGYQQTADKLRDLSGDHEQHRQFVNQLSERHNGLVQRLTEQAELHTGQMTTLEAEITQTLEPATSTEAPAAVEEQATVTPAAPSTEEAAVQVNEEQHQEAPTAPAVPSLAELRALSQNILNTAQKEKAVVEAHEKEYTFFSKLSADSRRLFMDLPDTQKQTVAGMLTEQRGSQGSDLNQKLTEALEHHQTVQTLEREPVFTLMGEKHKQVWSLLSQEQKRAIYARIPRFTLVNEAQVKNFWINQLDHLDEVGLKALNENVNHEDLTQEEQLFIQSRGYTKQSLDELNYAENFWKPRNK